MCDPSAGPKAFGVNLDAASWGSKDPQYFAAIVLGQILRCVDPQYGEGGVFRSITTIFQAPKDPNPDCLGAWAFRGHVAGSGFVIKLGAVINIFSDGSAPLSMDFEDGFGWQARESEKLVGFTMSCVDAKLDLLFQWPPGRKWLRTHGQWRHGEFFDR